MKTFDFVGSIVVSAKRGRYMLVADHEQAMKERDAEMETHFRVIKNKSEQIARQVEEITHLKSALVQLRSCFDSSKPALNRAKEVINFGKAI